MTCWGEHALLRVLNGFFSLDDAASVAVFQFADTPGSRRIYFLVRCVMLCKV